MADAIVVTTSVNDLPLWTDTPSVSGIELVDVAMALVESDLSTGLSRRSGALQEVPLSV